MESTASSKAQPILVSMETHDFWQAANGRPKVRDIREIAQRRLFEWVEDGVNE